MTSNFFQLRIYLHSFNFEQVWSLSGFEISKRSESDRDKQLVRYNRVSNLKLEKIDRLARYDEIMNPVSFVEA